MTRGEALDEMEDRFHFAPRGKAPERVLLERALDSSVRKILDKEEWRWAVTFGEVCTFSEGDREAILPPDFGVNFLKQDHSYSCYLIDTDDSVDSEIIYEAPEQLFRRFRTNEENGTPSWYTIHWTPTGKYMVVNPPADGNYTAIGAYKRTWNRDFVTDADRLPLPVPEAALYDAMLQFGEVGDLRGRAAEAMQSLYFADKDGFVLVPQNDDRYSRWIEP